MLFFVTGGLMKDYSLREVAGRFMPYFKKHRWTLVLDLFFASLTTVCELVLPVMLKYITNTAVADTASLTVRTAGRLGLLYLALRIMDCLAQFYMAYNGHMMGVRIETDMRTDAYSHLQKLSDTYYNNTKVGQIMGRITNDLFDVTEFAHHCPEEFLIAIIKGTVSFIVLIRINAPLTLILFLLVPVMVFVCIKIHGKFKKVQQAQRIQVGELNARIEDSLLGQKVVKAFTNEELECEKFAEGNIRYAGIKKEFYKWMSFNNAFTRLLDGLMYLVVLVYGTVLLGKGRLTAGDLIAYVLYISTLITTIRRIVDYIEQFSRGITGIERFLQIMDADIEIFDGPDAVPMERPEGLIEFKNVTFEYPDDKNRVLTNLNLTVHPGEKLAIVGPSGSGKTTLCNLIPRFYDVTEGSITIDGKDIKDYTLKSLRGNIGMVQQEVYLFSGTILDNILYGKRGAEREDAVKAAKLAGAHEFIMGLRDGYDTYVGERGVKLSGGQRQRISIARLFLKDPSIIILDEATSSLDNESEFAVAESLNELAKGRTTITIAHRLSSVRNSDRIVVLTDDGIAEEGSHETLLAQKGQYHELYTIAERLR